MQRIERSILVPYAASQMYALVNRVEDYPQFLPACTGIEIESRTQNTVVGKMNFEFKGIRQSLTTRNSLQKDRSVRLELVKGPFKRFDGLWRFDGISVGDDPDKEECRVTLTLDFELSNSALINRFLVPFIEPAVDKVIQAFIHRAHQVYG